MTPAAANRRASCVNASCSARGRITVLDEGRHLRRGAIEKHLPAARPRARWSGLYWMVTDRFGITWVLDTAA